MRDVGNKNLLIVIVLGVIIVGAVLSQDSYLIVKDDLDYDSGSQSSVTCGVYGYKDGEFIPIPVENTFLSPFRIGGVEYEEIAVRVEWTSTGEAIDWSTFTLTGDLDVSVMIETWQESNEPPDYGRWIPSWVDMNFAGDFSSGVANGSWSNIFILGTDLCLVENMLDRKTGVHAGEVGWGYAFSGRVDGSVYDDFGGGPLGDFAYFGGLSVWITYVAGYGITAVII